MQCPDCERDHNGVYRTLSPRNQNELFNTRIRVCFHCGFRFTTKEVIALTRDERRMLRKRCDGRRAA